MTKKGEESDEDTESDPEIMQIYKRFCSKGVLYQQ